MRISDWSSDVCSSDLAVSAASGGASQMEKALEAQKKRFLAAGDKYDKLTQLQREVIQRRAQYEKLAERTIQLRLESNTTDSGIRPIGEAVASNTPAGLPTAILLVMGAAFGDRKSTRLNSRH